MILQKYKHQGGFTIIETLIVLVIAGLILTMIFLALPALQRNSHNNQRKQDVSAILGAVSQYQLNHSGTFPEDDFSSLLGRLKLSLYSTDASPPDITITASPPNYANDTSMEQVKIFNRSKCDATASNFGQPTGAGAGYSDIVALYAIETSGGSAPRCQEL